jgi:hypothetical protein
MRETTPEGNGIIVVSLPKSLAMGAGFSFALPTQIVEANAVSQVPIVATTMAGTALPSWIVYNAENKSFVATSVPEGGLPIQVLVSIGNQRAVVMISVQADR